MGQPPTPRHSGTGRNPAQRLALCFCAVLAAFFFLTAPTAAQDRTIVNATEPLDISVTLYRDPNRREGQEMNRNNPRGFAMISETRRVSLPRGESTIRFNGVAEGMVAVSAIVTGLPGGTIEKNRNADLLSPASLIDGTLGNRVRITRTNPGTGEQVSESAIVRTRADGGLVLQTSNGYEAVRCSGLPERLEFNRLPSGLSPQPVFTIDTQDDTGGAYTVTLTYLAWGFDWQANYVATLGETDEDGETSMRLLSWLTLLNDNGQSFEDADLLVVAGRLNIVSNFARLSNPPQARPLRLTCYPLGSSLAGSPVPNYDRPTPPYALMGMMDEDYDEFDDRIVVTAQRVRSADMNANSPISSVSEAVEENLGDLKLYRVPEQVTVAAQSLKQVAFLSKSDVRARQFYNVDCSPYGGGEEPVAARILLRTVNDEEHGLGVALPTGGMAIFEPSSRGEMLIGQDRLRDYASGQDVEIELGESHQVFSQCEALSPSWTSRSRSWHTMRATLSNANPAPIKMRINLGAGVAWQYRDVENRLKDGVRITEVTVPANGERIVEWRVRGTAR